LLREFGIDAVVLRTTDESARPPGAGKKTGKEEIIEYYKRRKKMDTFKQELIKQLNHALELEHAAQIQYLAHAELINGLNAEKIIERLKEIASDEAKHADMFRNLIGNYLGGEPSMGIAATHRAQATTKILEINIKNEKEAIDQYKQIYQRIVDNKSKLQYEFETLEHDLRHVICDEQEHAAELSVLLGK
jgi:bacterioferritin (cytochrome b1)